jgi:cytochrome c oxidase subunit 3
MIEEIHLSGAPKKTMTMNPKKFLLWMFMVSIVMIFASLTSAYIVRQSEGNWLQYELPSALWVTTAILLISSLTMHWALRSVKAGNMQTAKITLGLTLLFGVAFLIGQVRVWQVLVANEVYFVGNPGGSFLYVLTGFHGVHLISGLIYLLVMFIMILRDKINAERTLPMELSTTYWHFLDGLWLYLFVFLLLNH